MRFQTIASTTVFALIAVTAAAPTQYNSALDKRQQVTTAAGSVNLDAASEAVGSFSEFSPIEDGFLEQDNDSGDGNDNGSSAVSVSNGFAGNGGSGSAANSNGSTSDTSSYCSATGCTSGAAASNSNNTSSSTSSDSVTVADGPLVTTSGPLVSVGTRLRRFIAVLSA